MTHPFEDRQPVILQHQGEKIFGVLHQPLPLRPVPAVLMCHGYAGNKAGRYRIYVLIAQKLAELGIASLRIDFRGSGDSEGNFSDMTISSEVSDALKGIEYLRNQANIDKDRIGLLGNSLGGAIATLTAAQDGNIKSLVLLAALFSSKPWREKWESLAKQNTDASRKELAKSLDGNLPGNNFLKELFALDLKPALAKIADVPLLHIHSEFDDRIPIEHAEQYKQGREGSQAESRWVRLHQCDHNFSSAEERSLVVEETANWFKRTLILTLGQR